MKVGLLTFHTAQNYGAVLQAYGLQRFILKMGHSCEIVDYECSQFKKDYALIRFTIRIKRFFRSIQSIEITKRLRIEYASFVKENLICSQDSYNPNTIQQCEKMYDTFITGSDQVWDAYCAGFDPVYFLHFVSDNQKKNSYAASFNKANIPEKLMPEFIKRVKAFHHISCRESAGADFVKRVTGREATVNVDPAFLLSGSEWEKLSVAPELAEDYIFVYPVGHSQEMLEYAKKLGKKTGLKVVYLVCSKPWKDPQVDFVTGAGPCEFLGYIRNARYVVTNSFHGTAFSLIFQKQFNVFCGCDGKGNARVQNVLAKCGLLDRIIRPESIDHADNVIDWHAFQKWVAEEQEKSRSCLCKIMEGK